MGGKRKRVFGVARRRKRRDVAGLSRLVVLALMRVSTHSDAAENRTGEGGVLGRGCANKSEG